MNIVRLLAMLLAIVLADARAALAADVPAGPATAARPAHGFNRAVRNPFYGHGTDPSAHVFAGRLYVYVGIDADDVYPAGSGNRMYRYQVLSTTDMRDWTDHGTILHLRDVPWAESLLWAYDVVERDGLYVMYFCAKARGDSKGARLGVATARNPEGPFIPQPGYLRGAPGQSDPDGIDPTVFIDDDGSAVLIWKTWGDSLPGETDPGNLEKIGFVHLDRSLLAVAGPATVLAVRGAPNDGTAAGTRLFFEGPWIHKHAGRYYLTYPATKGGWGVEHMVYATSDRLEGPYDYRGQILENDQVWTTNFTTHGSTVRFLDRWWFFNHVKPKGAIGRMPWVVEMHHRPDGSIEPLHFTDAPPVAADRP
jgi:GPH family glycoside/pentoside/hexuronide:cation symporter